MDNALTSTATTKRRATHYSIRNGMAACGANQGVKRQARVILTRDGASVTCLKCSRIPFLYPMSKDAR